MKAANQSEETENRVKIGINSASAGSRDREAEESRRPLSLGLPSAGSAFSYAADSSSHRTR